MANLRIVIYSQLFSESILFYFFLIPIFAVSQKPIPFWSYLLITGLCIILFDLSLRISKNYAVYIPVILLIFCLMYYILHYPLVVVLLWIIFITWRHNKGPSDNQMTVLVLTMLMLFIGIIFFNYSNLVWMAIFQILITGGGYWGHLMTETEIPNKPMRTSLTLGVFLLLLLAGAALIYGFYPFVTRLIGITFSGIGALFEYTVLGIAGTADKLGVDFRFLQDMVDDETIKQAATKFGENMDELSEQTDKTSSYNGGIDMINWWTILLVVMAIIAVTIFLYRKKFAGNNTVEKHGSNDSPISTSPIESAPKGSQLFRDRALFTRPNDPIRKKVLKFEQQAHRKRLGRNPSETIEEWFDRLNLNPAHLDLYQKVRYGEKNLTKDERKTIHNLLDYLISKYQ
ncbi:DUF4129 domain-containing protein [Lentibacillus amyloliquefaciens]|uniref:DUF4129 domain-containing protein n=1 Tax=Lentibacillus amyloliquefaciens TaxID=1472767 RepID=A0A0U3WBN5_9BACI|nr:DUF4129 domain-containing protein [Lentibacillus amyloliquefaciens]ALX47215.1 hypothetical protein AOX59_00535 [Lentibacillus amyloliquefaciens]